MLFDKTFVFFLWIVSLGFISACGSNQYPLSGEGVGEYSGASSDVLPEVITPDFLEYLGNNITGTNFHLPASSQSLVHAHVSKLISDSLKEFSGEELFNLKKSTKRFSIESCEVERDTVTPAVRTVDRQYVISSLMANLWFNYSENPMEWSCLFERVYSSKSLGEELMSESKEISLWAEYVEGAADSFSNNLMTADYYRLCILGDTIHESNFKLADCFPSRKCDGGGVENMSRCQITSQTQDYKGMRERVIRQWHSWMAGFTSADTKR